MPRFGRAMLAEWLLDPAVTRLSEEAFRAVWDNSDDAEYDRL